MRPVAKPEKPGQEREQREVTNLALAEEKLRQELVDLRRPYLFRNPQLLTALITSVGAIIGVSILISENYFKVREQLNTLQAEKTIRLNTEAREASERAERARNDAATIMASAKATEATAAKTVADSNRRIADASTQLAETRSKLERAELIAASQELANKAEAEVRAGDHYAALKLALEAWRKSRTTEAREAIVHAYTLPVAKVDSGSLGAITAFSPDGERVVTVVNRYEGFGLASSARVWDSLTGKLLFDLTGTMEQVDSARYSPDGRLIVTANHKGTAVLWDAANGERLRTLESHKDEIYDLTFSQDSTYLATAGKDSVALIWDVATGRQLMKFTEHVGPILSIGFSNDGLRVATLGTDKTVRLWDRATGKQQWVVAKAPAVLNRLAFERNHRVLFSSNGSRIFVVGGDYSDEYTYILKAASGEQIAELVGDVDGPTSFSPDGQVVTSSGHGVRMWDGETGRPLKTAITAQTVDQYFARFAFGGQRLATIGITGIKVWDAGSGRLLTKMDTRFRPDLFAVSQDGRRIATSQLGGLSTMMDIPPYYTAVYQIVTPDDVDHLFP